MASSAPSEMTQAATKCEFCEQTEIQLNCIDCCSYLCQPCCDKIHFTVDKQGKHQIIYTADAASIESTEKHRRCNLDNLKCSKHEGKKCVMFCNDCKQTLCVLCNKESHKSHDTDDLWDCYDELLLKINNFKDTVDRHFDFFKSHEERFLKSQTLYNKAKILIANNEKEIKKAIEEYTAALLEKLEYAFQPIQDELTVIETNLNDVSRRKENIGKVLSSHSAEDVFSVGASLDTKLPEKTTHNVHPAEVNFISCQLSELALNKVFGEVNISTLSNLNTYITGLEVSYVSNILHCNDGTSIIGESYNGKVQKVKFENDAVKVITTKDIKCHDMTLTENGDIIISTKDQGLMLYTTDGTLKTYKTLSPLQTLGVHMNEQKELIVGLSESSVIDIKPGSTRKVVVLNQSGEIIHTYEHDNDGKTLFTWPWRIVTCNDIICVIDTQRKDYFFDLMHEGRVVGLDYQGHIRWTYQGEGLTCMTAKTFWPEDMTVTTTSMFLVSDRYNQAIHVLNHAGQVIVCRGLQDLEISNPAGLGIDLEGRLWVGEWKCWNIHRLELHVD